MRRLLLALSALMALSVAPLSHAGSNAGTLASSVTLSGDCTLTVNGMAFGTSSALIPANVNVTSPMQVACSLGTPYTIAIGSSTTSGSGVTPPAGYNHEMTSQGFGVSGRPLYLPYNLTQDAAGTLPWGYTVGTDTVSGTGQGQANTLTVYGSLTSGTTGSSSGRPSALIPGNYLDTLTVTLSY